MSTRDDVISKAKGEVQMECRDLEAEKAHWLRRGAEIRPTSLTDRSERVVSWKRRMVGRFGSTLLGLWFLGGCQNKPEHLPAAPKESSASTAKSAERQLAWFRELPPDSGVHFVYHSGHEKEFLFPEIIGGGAALFDLENDGDLDLFLVQGGSIRKPDPSLSRDRLFRNDGNLKFTDITESAGLVDSDYGMGVAAGDFNNDGFRDLFVTNYGQNRLLKNNGDGTFSDVTKAAGIEDRGWSTSAAFFDADADGDLDLYVCHYVVWSPQNELKCFKQAGIPDYCSPQAYNDPEPDAFFRNRGDGTFENRTVESGINATKGNGLGVVASDFDGDGDQDLFVANDMTPNLLWVNDGQGIFTEQAMSAGCGVDRDGQVKAGMGVALGDLRGSGLLDLIVVNLAGQSDSLFENQGGWFIDRTTQRGLALATRPYTRFGVGMHDFDNDSRLDLFFANGAISVPVDPNAIPFAEANLLLQGSADGKFSLVSGDKAGAVSSVATSRGAAFGDLNNDGLMDIVVVNRDSPAQILINQQAQAGHWIGFDVRNEQGLLAYGAKVLVEIGARTYRKDLSPDYSYLSSNDHRLHFGLGADQGASVKVEWDSKNTERFGPFPAGTYVSLRKGQGTAVTSAELSK